MSSIVTYANDGRFCFCQVRFDSRERVLISMAGTPIPSIRVVRLILGGFVPRQIIWEYNATMAASSAAYFRNLATMFPPEPDGPAHSLDLVAALLLACSSIAEARDALLEREQRLGHP